MVVPWEGSHPFSTWQIASRLEDSPRLVFEGICPAQAEDLRLPELIRRAICKGINFRPVNDYLGVPSHSCSANVAGFIIVSRYLFSFVDLNSVGRSG